jgi:hypothetical protein
MLHSLCGGVGGLGAGAAAVPLREFFFFVRHTSFAQASCKYSGIRRQASFPVLLSCAGCKTKRRYQFSSRLPISKIHLKSPSLLLKLPVSFHH